MAGTELGEARRLPVIPLTMQDWASIATASASAIALFLSLRANRISTRAMLIASREYEESQPRLVPYLAQSFSYSPENHDFRVYGFGVTLANPSRTANSIQRVDLLVTQRRDSGELLTRSIPHEENLAGLTPVNTAGALRAPVQIPPHGSLATWLFFKVDNRVIRDAPVQRLLISLTDVHGNSYEIEPIIVTDYADEESLAKRTDRG